MDGAFAEYVVVPNPMLGQTFFKMPETMSWEEASVVEPMSVGCFAVDQAQIKPGATVVVLRLGVIGQGIAQMARVAGAGKVIVSEPSQKRLEVAKELGADVIINPKTANPVEIVREITSEGMAHIVFECSGTPDAFLQGLNMLGRYGKMMQVAVFSKPFEIQPDQINLLTSKNLTIRGCAGGSGWPKAFELVKSGQVKTQELITHIFDLDSIKDAFKTQANADESIKVVVRP